MTVRLTVMKGVQKRSRQALSLCGGTEPTYNTVVVEVLVGWHEFQGLYRRLRKFRYCLHALTWHGFTYCLQRDIPGKILRLSRHVCTWQQFTYVVNPCHIINPLKHSLGHFFYVRRKWLPYQYALHARQVYTVLFRRLAI